MVKHNQVQRLVTHWENFLICQTKSQFLYDIKNPYESTGNNSGKTQAKGMREWGCSHTHKIHMTFKHIEKCSVSFKIKEV